MVSLHFTSSLPHDLSDTFASHSQVGGLLAYGVSHIDNPNLKSWQVLFMLLGLVTVLWGCFVGWFLPDSPMRAKCWPAETRVRLVERVRPNMSGLQNKVFKRYQLVEALLDPAVWLLFLLQVLSCLTSGGASAFGNIVITVRSCLLALFERGQLLTSISLLRFAVLRLYYASDAASVHRSRRCDHRHLHRTCLPRAQDRADHLHPDDPVAPYDCRCVSSSRLSHFAFSHSIFLFLQARSSS